MIKNNKIKVSVCMITYNHAEYIREAIDGVLMQKTDFPIELIIGEDCSTDETRSICLEYKEKYPDQIRLLLPDKNLGMINNFIKTLKSATGKYIALCEGDDYWTDPFKLQKQVDFLENNPEYSLVSTNRVLLQQRTQKITPQVIDMSQFTLDEMFVYNKITTLTVCFKTDLALQYFHEIKPEEHNWKMGDYPMWIYFMAHSKIKHLSDFTGVYRILDVSASHSLDHNKRLSFSYSVEDIRNYFYQLYSDKLINKERTLFRMKKRLYIDDRADAFLAKDMNFFAEANSFYKMYHIRRYCYFNFLRMRLGNSFFIKTGFSVLEKICNRVFSDKFK